MLRMEDQYYVGVDVGTSSVRAALVNQHGKIISTATHPIDILEPQPDFYEQSSNNIWESCCNVIKSVTANIVKKKVKGIGFDATCSLVVLDEDFQPLSISPTDELHWNIVMWMDHRAADQADRINKTQHKVLKHVGGTISLEMETPKLLWLKENMKTCWNKAGHFFDLPDFLSWKSTDSLSRSLCTLVSKWTYQADSDGHGWDDSYFTEIGLEDLANNSYAKIGKDVLSPGSPCGSGLTERAAKELGLLKGTPVATSIIDAHAGGLGCLGCSAVSKDDLDLGQVPLTSRLALICGTSTCHMTVSSGPLLVPGVWGPNYSAIVPGLWSNEGGQSASGKLIDHVIETHAAYGWVKLDADNRAMHIHSVLQEILEYRAKKDNVGNLAELTRGLHVWPDYHGNRSPLADASLKGMVCGLTLTAGAEGLALQYLATVQALAYGTRHILDVLTVAGHEIKVIYACGGLAKNPLFMQTHADVTGLPIVLPDTSESVLLGAAILGASASGDFSDIQEAMTAMAGDGQIIKPDLSLKQYHDRKYEVFHKMVNHQKEYKDIMNGACS